MKRIVVVGALLFFAAYLYNTYADNRRAEEAAQIKKQHRIEEARTTIQEMANRTGAIDDWKAKLDEEKSVLEGVMTFELEDLWIRDRPIIFIGYIDDVRSYNEEYYQIRVRQSWIHSKSLLRLNAYLLLLTEKNRMRAFMSNNDWQPDAILPSNNVAVAAQIGRITVEHETDSDGSTTEMRVAEGRLVDIQHIGDVRL